MSEETTTREIRYVQPKQDASARARLLAGRARGGSTGGGGQGEGSRGGKIIGHTGSGKPIYGNANHPSHSSFTAKDHDEARAKHAELAKLNPRESMKHGEEADKHRELWKTAGQEKVASKKGSPPQIKGLGESLGGKSALAASGKQNLKVKKDVVGKKDAGGEGSRGGKIIGHTGSGKPIYGNANHPSHKEFTPGDHAEAAGKHLKEANQLKIRSAGESRIPLQERKSKIAHHEKQSELHRQSVVAHQRGEGKKK